MNPNNALYNGETVPVEPSAAVLTELMLSGWTQEKINHALSEKPWKVEEYIYGSPLEDYKRGFGYLFDWGHVIQKFSPPDEDVPCYFVTWDYCLDGMLSRAHREGLQLVDLCDMCEKYLENMNHSSWPVFLSGGAPMSSFTLHILTTDASGIALLEIERARKWMANIFLDKVLPDLLDFLEDKIPYREIQ